MPIQKKIVCEKPLATSVEDCKKMIVKACDDFLANPLIEEYIIEISE